jgi:hypothetical protein
MRFVQRAADRFSSVMLSGLKDTQRALVVVEAVEFERWRVSEGEGPSPWMMRVVPCG